MVIPELLSLVSFHNISVWQHSWNCFFKESVWNDYCLLRRSLFGVWLAPIRKTTVIVLFYHQRLQEMREIPQAGAIPPRMNECPSRLPILRKNDNYGWSLVPKRQPPAIIRKRGLTSQIKEQKDYAGTFLNISLSQNRCLDTAAIKYLISFWTSSWMMIPSSNAVIFESSSGSFL